MSLYIYINDLCIGLHAKCNWKCSYCVARWDEAEIDEGKILEDIEPHMDKLKTLWLSGGEPGLLSVQFWDYLFHHSKSQLKICTNGTFIKRGYANRYRERIAQIMVHCVEELDQDIDPYVLQYLKENKVIVSANFVIHKNNPHLIGNFLNKYSDMQFDINFADQTFTEVNEQYNEKYDCELDRDSIIETITQLGKFKNYGHYTNFLTKKLIQNDFRDLNPWSSKNHD